jgi:O-antigen/teichoic acid export membrane protein
MKVLKLKSTTTTQIMQGLKENRVLFTNTGSLVISTGLTSVVGFAYWWIAARLFPPQAVGLASAIISAMTLIATISVLGLRTLLTGELKLHPGKEGPLISASSILVGVVGGCVGIAFAVLAPLITAQFQPIQASIWNVALFALGVSITAVGFVLDGAITGLLLAKLGLYRSGLLAVVKLFALLAIGLWLSQKTGMSIFVTWLIGSAISVLVVAAWPILKRKYSRSIYVPHWQLLKKMVPLAIQHHMINLVQQIPNLALPVLVTALLSAQVNAWFYVSAMIVNFITTVSLSLTNVLYALSSVEPEVLAKKMRLTLALGIAAALLANIVIQPGANLILGFFGHNYAAQAASCLRILALGAFPIVILNHFIMLCRIQKRLASVMLPIAMGAALELIGPTIGAHFGGLTGLSVGSDVALFIEAAFMFRRVYLAVHFSKASHKPLTRAI